MIKSDQPTIFNKNIIAAVSSAVDGNMKFGINDNEDVLRNRRAFLRKAGVDLEHTTLVPVTYDTDDFLRYKILSKEHKSGSMHGFDSLGFAADGLVVDQPNHALFLPLADCVGAVIHDPINHVLMLSHLGRHSTEVNGGVKSIEYLQKHFTVNLKDIRVWLSPAVGNATYRLHKFEGKSLHDVLRAQFLEAGIEEDHLEISEVDTAQDDNYFSHSQHRKRGLPGLSSRFAVVAMMRD